MTAHRIVVIVPCPWGDSKPGRNAQIRARMITWIEH
jgi:hypothetical protein